MNTHSNIDKNDATYWFPKIKDSLPVPNTIIAEYNHHACVNMGDTQPIINLIKIITNHCSSIGYPIFIKTTLTSAKHEGPEYYKIENEDEIGQRLWDTIEDSELKLWPYATPLGIMIREFLELDYGFTAFNGLPIAREFRIFADKDSVKCFHPYWPVDSIINPNDKNWKDILLEYHKTPDNINELLDMAMTAAKLCGDDEWSIDFAKKKSGEWVLIDMALAKDSYHHPH